MDAALLRALCVRQTGVVCACKSGARVFCVCAYTAAHSTPESPSLSGVTTRVARNPNFAKLQAGYLFPEVRL
jgi:hypothetical protein